MVEKNCNKETTEDKRAKLNSLISLSKNSKGESPSDELGIQNISKIECQRYATQKVEVVRIYFKSSGSTGNNTPFTYPEELPIGTYNEICEDLYDVRTTVVVGYGTVNKKENINPKEVDIGLKKPEEELPKEEAKNNTKAEDVW